MTMDFRRSIAGLQYYRGTHGKSDKVGPFSFRFRFSPLSSSTTFCGYLPLLSSQTQPVHAPTPSQPFLPSDILPVNS